MNLPLLRLRACAVWCCVYFGVLPWWVYERTCHYAEEGYWRHLGRNLTYAARWVLARETDEDVEFERAVNDSPHWTRWHRPPQ